MGRYTLEFFVSLSGVVPALLIAEDRDALRAFLENSVVGLALTDDATRAGCATFWEGPWGWTSDDGHRHATLDTYLLLVRGLYALLEEDCEATRSELRKWLPPTAEHRSGMNGRSFGTPLLLVRRADRATSREQCRCAPTLEAILPPLRSFVS